MAERVTNISDEMLAAFLDGNTTAPETQSVLDAVASDDRLQEFLSLSLQVDEAMSGIDLDLSLSKNRPFPVPGTIRPATCWTANGTTTSPIPSASTMRQ